MKKILIIVMIAFFLSNMFIPIMQATLDKPPSITSEFPTNGATNVPVDIQSIYATFTDLDNDGDSTELGIDIEAFDWQGEISSQQIWMSTSHTKPSGTYSVPSNSKSFQQLEFNTTYTWYANATTDSWGEYSTYEVFTFTTESNSAPIINTYNITDNSYPYDLGESPSGTWTNIPVNPDTIEVFTTDKNFQVQNVSVWTNASGSWKMVNYTYPVYEDAISTNYPTNTVDNNWNTYGVVSATVNYYSNFTVPDNAIGVIYHVKDQNENFSYNLTDYLLPTQEIFKIENDPSSDMSGFQYSAWDYDSWTTFEEIEYNYENVYEDEISYIIEDYTFTNTSWIDTWNTDYWISINITDGITWTNETCKFSTGSPPVVGTMQETANSYVGLSGLGKDGDWDTGIALNDPTWYVNYTIPENAISATYRVRQSWQGTNYTSYFPIPETLMDEDYINIKIQWGEGCEGLSYVGYDFSDDEWVSIGSNCGAYKVGEYTYFIEEAMIWHTGIVEPESGIDGIDTIYFNTTIFDADNDTQSVYAIIREGTNVLSNNSMSYVSGFNISGANYTFSKIMTQSGIFNCIFSSYDGTTWTTTDSFDFIIDRNVSFNVNFPSYLEVGQYIHGDGTLTNYSSEVINNVWVYTKIIDSSWSVITGTSINKYIQNGDYQYTFSTSSMIPGVYYVLINYTLAGVDYTTNSTIYISNSSGAGHYAADIFFAFYNYNTGIGLDANAFKIYVDDATNLSGDRIYGNVFHDTYTGDILYYRVDDYFNNKIYPTDSSYATLSVVSTDEFVDIPVDWNSFSVKNMNSSIIYFKMTTDSTTYSQYLYPYEPFYWNVLDGTYTINLTYYSTVTGAVTGYSEEEIVISKDAYYWINGYKLEDIFIQGNALLNQSVVIFNFYNTNEGLGIPKETLKVYINGSRLMDNIYYTTDSSNRINVTVKDYYNTTLYHNNFTVDSPYLFLDLGLTFHSWLFGNTNNDYYMISILKEGATRWWERGIVPGGQTEFLIPSGTYAMRIYDKDNTEIYNSTLPASIPVVNSKVYVIYGSNLTEIINGQSVITGQLLELNRYVTPNIIKVGYNIPFIRLAYDCDSPLNKLLELNYTLVCPPQILEGTTYNHTYTNRTIYPCIPGNTSSNGTVTVPDVDRLWFQGGTADWVNVSYTNGTLIQNTSYVPTFLDINGAPDIMVYSSHNISLTRETRYHQVKEFDYLLYTDLNKYQATVNFTNVLPKVIEKVTLYIAFADDGATPDYGGVEVYDVSNSMTLTEGEHYDSSAKGIELGIASMYAGEYRQFRVTYYVAEENIQPKEAIVVLDDFGKIEMHKNQNYNYLRAQWINRESTTFIGPIYIQFNFTMPQTISPESIDIWDDSNVRFLNRDEYTFGTHGVTITQDAVGRVSPSGSRTYEIYYLYIVEPTPFNIVGGFLNDPIIENVPGIGQLLGIHLVVIILSLIGFTAVFSGKDYKEHMWIYATCILFIFLSVMAWLNPA